MTKQEAHKILYEDAFKCELLNFSILEWKDRVENLEQLNRAAKIAGSKVVDAIEKFIWRR